MSDENKNKQGIEEAVVVFDYGQYGQMQKLDLQEVVPVQALFSERD